MVNWITPDGNFQGNWGDEKPKQKKSVCPHCGEGTPVLVAKIGDDEIYEKHFYCPNCGAEWVIEHNPYRDE